MKSNKKSLKLDEIWIKAEKHRQASRVGAPVPQHEYELCTCCDQVIDKEPISMWEHTKELESLGFGYPLWFSFLKYCIILMLVLIASKTANILYMSATENYDFCFSHGGLSPIKEEAKVHKPMQIDLNLHRQDVEGSEHESQRRLEEISSDKYLPLQGPSKKESLQAVKNRTTEHDIEECTSFMVFLSHIKRQKMSQNYFLKAVEFVIHLIALVAVRNMILKEEQYYDERSTLISDYAIIIQNLPDVDHLQRKIQYLFQEEFGMHYGVSDSEIMDFLYIFNDEELTEINQKKETIEYKILTAQAYDNKKQEEEAREELENFEWEWEQKVTKVRKQIQNDTIKCNKMIVILRTQGDKASVLYSYKEAMKQKRDLNKYFYESQKEKEIFRSLKQKNKIKILMKEAPEPNEIIWENIVESDQARKFLIIRGYLLTFLFLAVITLIFYFIMLSKTKLFLKAYNLEMENPQSADAHAFKIFATFIVFAAMICVTLFNKFVMGDVLHHFVHMEHHAYTDKENHSFALKYALGMFFTTALMTLAVEAVTYNNFFSHNYGVIEEESIMFFVTAFIVPLIWLIHPFHIRKTIKRKKNYGTLMTQREANELVEDFPYMLGKRYAEIFEIIWFTFLYSQLIPLGSFLMLFGLMFYYWVDKYNFLRRSAVKKRVSGKMAILGLKSLDATLFISPAGQLLFRWLLHHKFDYPSLIFMLIGIVYTLMPITSLIWELNGEKFMISQKPYDEATKMFKETYTNMHPVYKLTHAEEVALHREEVQEYFKNDLKKIKHYGTGRGNYERQMTMASAKHYSEVMESERNQEEEEV